MVMLTSPSYALLQLAKQIKTLKIVLQAYLHYNYPQFSASAANLGNTVLKRIDDVLNKDTSVEIMIIRE